MTFLRALICSLAASLVLVGNASAASSATKTPPAGRYRHLRREEASL